MASGLLLPFGSPLPLYQTIAAGFTSFATFALDASGDKAGCAFDALNADQITHIGFRCASITGTPPTYKIGLQGINTSGVPDGTYLGGGSPASATFTPSGAGGYGTGTWHWIALDNAYTPVRGEGITIVVEHSSGTVDASNLMTITLGLNNGAHSVSHHRPMTVTSTGSWSKGATDFPCFGLKGSSVIATGDVRPLKVAGTVQAVPSPTEAGMAFTVPSGWTDTISVLAVRFAARTMSTNSNFAVTLYSSPTSSPSVLQQIEVDGDWFGLSSNQVGVGLVVFDEVSLSSLTAGTEYGIGIVARDVATDLAIYQIETDSAGDWDAWPFGQQCSYMQRTLVTGYTSTATLPNETTNFTKTTTRRPIIEVILGDMTESAGGGGLAANPIRGFVS